jgi:hypothetical protein
MYFEYPLTLCELYRRLVAHKMPFGISVEVPAQFEFIRRELREKVRPYFRDLIEPIDLYHNFYCFIGEYFCSGRVHLVMRRIVGLYFKFYDVGIALVLQFEVAIDEGIRNTPTIVKYNDLLTGLPYEF